MKTIHIIVTVLLTVVAVNLKAQELHVFFDAQSKEVTYKKNGEITHKPKAKNGEQIIFHLQNFNNFLYNAEVKGNSKNVYDTKKSESISNFLSDPGGGNNIFSGLLSTNGAAMSGIKSSNQIEIGGLGYGANVKESNQLSQIKASYDSALQEMFKVEKQLKYIGEDLDLYVEAKAVDKIIIQELAQLKLNPRLHPSQIKTLSLEFLEKIFGTNETSEITLTKLLEKADSKNELLGYKNKLSDHEQSYQESVNTVAEISAQLNILNFENSNAKKLKQSSFDVLSKSENVLSSISENKSRLDQYINEATKQDVNRLTALRYEYESLSKSDFTETFRLNAEDDYTSISIKLIPHDSVGKLKMLNTIEMPTLKIPVYGGLKINTSVGLTFGKFMNPQNNYYVKDSIIVAQPKGKFTPILTSFFHFYAQSSSEITLGGSFGIGLPLSSENGQQSASFFIGPSLILGKGDRIVLSAGIMGGRTEKLDRGFHIGDSFKSDIDIVPTYSAYDIGFYFGLTFNLISK